MRPSFLMFLSFLLLLAVCTPHKVFATEYPKVGTWSDQDCAAMNQKIQDAQNYRAQRRTQNTIDMFSLMAPASEALLACLDRLDAIMDKLQGMSSLGLGTIINGVVDQMIRNVINQVCNVVASTLDQAVNLINSQVNRFCIPLPSLNLNLRAPHLPSGPPCNGTPLVQSVPLDSAPTPASGGITDFKSWLNFIKTNNITGEHGKSLQPNNGVNLE